MKNYALALLFIGITSISCQKDKDGDDGGNRTELITSAAWKYDKAYMGNTSTPADDYIEDCIKDNIITLKSDGTGTINEGSTKCDPDDEQTTNITWQFKENETVLSTPNEIGPGISGDIKINTLTSTKLQVQKQVPMAPFGNVLVIIDLKH